ncbi:MAG TPA: type II and III secretion system protein [bacterium]|nr:type II and III secretion system protein [bacterium]
MRRAIAVSMFIVMLLAAFCLAGPALEGSKHTFVPKEYPIEHTSPDEMVSLSSGTPFAQALFILSKFSNKFEKRVIIDPAKHKGNIGVDIDNMHWKKAFEMVLRANGIWYVRYDTYYEIVEPTSEPEKTKGGTKKEGVTADTREIRIKATFFEGDRRVMRELGIDWTTVRNGSLAIGAMSSGAQRVSENMFLAGLAKTFYDGRASVEVLLSTLELAEKGRIIATPEVVATAGKPAKILVGQEFAVNTRDYAGNIITTFYETGTILEVTPSVFKGKKGEEFINLAVKVERSSLVDPVNVTINKTEANSSILLYSGEDTAIAGLYSTERSRQRQGIPFLKDLPWWVLGIRYVAGYDRMEKKDKELVILLHASLLPKLAERLSAPPKDTDFKRLQRETETTIKSFWPRPGEGENDEAKLKD